MKNNIKIGLISIVLVLIGFSCSNDYPVDADGLLITDKTDALITYFDLLGPDNRTVLVPNTMIINDSLSTIVGTAAWGTNMTHLKPKCSLSIDAKVTPAMGVWVDFSLPQTYTVISGNRKHTKKYTINISLQQ